VPSERFGLVGARFERRVDGFTAQCRRPAQSNPQVLDLGSRRPGTYIVACYLDVNANRKMDRGMFSNPIEPYAFSNNARNRFSEPDLADQRFSHLGALQKLMLKPAF